MKLVVLHRSFFDWKLVTADEVIEDDVALPSIHGPNFRHVQIHYLQPNYTEVHIPDSDIDRMVADHEEGVKNARKGYKTIQVGGPLDGKEVEVAPRNLPLKSRNEIIAHHLENSVFPFHFPSDAVTEVKLVDHGLDPDDAAKLERFLNRRFVHDPEGDD